MKKQFSVINNERNRIVDTSTVFNIKNDIIYQTGSIVSKVILKKDTGNVTLFAFDEGEMLSPHSAPFDAMVEVVEGNVEIMIGDDFFNLSEDDMIIMPAGIVHSVKAISKFKMILTMIKS